jgi:hypothetical protein
VAVTLYDIMRPTAILSGAALGLVSPLGNGEMWFHWAIAGLGVLVGVWWCWPLWSLAKYTQTITAQLAATARESVFVALYIVSFLSLVFVAAPPAGNFQSDGRVLTIGSIDHGRGIGGPRRESMIWINQLRWSTRPRVAQPHH